MQIKYINKTHFIALCLLLIFAATLLSAVFNAKNFASSAFAEGILTIDQTVTPIFTDKDRYVTLNQPSAIASGGGTFVALDGDRFVSKGEVNNIITGTEGITKDSILDLCVFREYLFALYSFNDKTELAIFNLKEGGRLAYAKNPFDIAVSEGEGAKLPVSITINEEGGYLYASYLESGKVYAYSLSVNNGLQIGAKTIINTASGGWDLKLTYSAFDNTIYLLNGCLDNDQNMIKRIRKVTVLNPNETIFLDVNDFAKIGKIKLTATSGYLVLSNGASVMAVSKNDSTKSFTKSSAPVGMAANGDNILFSFGGTSVGEYSITNGDYKKISDYGYKGSADTLLNSPIAVCAYENYYFIGDRANKRLVRYEMENGTAVKSIKTLDLSSKMGSISSVSVDNNGLIYCGDEGGKLTVWTKDFNESGSYSLEAGNSADKLVFDANNNLYVLSATTGRIYKKNYNEAGFTELYVSVKHIADIGISYLGNVLYLVIEDNSERKIVTRDLLKNEDRTEFTIDLTSYNITKIIALEVDKKGNMALCATVATGAKVFYIERKQDKYELKRELVLSSGDTQIDFSRPVDFIITADCRMITVNPNANLLGFISNKTAAGEWAIPFATTIDSDFKDPEETAEFDVIRASADCYAYIKPNNFENVLKITENSLFVTLGLVVENEGNSYYYIKVDSYKCYLPIKFAEKVANSAAAYEKGTVKHRNVKIYSKPIANDDLLVYTIDKKDAIIDIESAVGFYSDDIKSGFVKVTYGTYSGYADSERISKYTFIEYGTTEQNFMKIKATTVGAKIPLYKSADASSEVLATLSDGDKVVLLEPFADEKEYILVSYNGVSGYITSSALFKNGLSTSQIIAISLVSGVIVIGIALFFIARAIRKKNYGNYDDSDLGNGYYDDSDYLE